jgi:hypothetical protein
MIAPLLAAVTVILMVIIVVARYAVRRAYRAGADRRELPGSASRFFWHV